MAIGSILIEVSRRYSYSIKPTKSGLTNHGAQTIKRWSLLSWDVTLRMKTGYLSTVLQI